MEYVWYRPFVPYTTHRLKRKEFDIEIYENDTALPNLISWLDTEIHKWCLVNGFLLVLPRKNGMGKIIEDTYTCAPNITEDNVNIVDTVFTKNFRMLTSQEECKPFINYLVDTRADFIFNSFLQFHMQVTSQTNTKALETYITKIYTSLQQYSDMADDTTHRDYQSWAKIHEQYPFIWLLYEIQRHMHRYKNITA